MRLPTRKEARVFGVAGALFLAGVGLSANIYPPVFGGVSLLEGRVCPPVERTLEGVDEPERLIVRNPCQKASGTVLYVKPKHDGDLHIGLKPDRGYESLLNSANDGVLVTELMPRDQGHLPTPAAGDHLEVVGAYVNDSTHGWNEIHPIFLERWDDGTTSTSGPG